VDDLIKKMQHADTWAKEDISWILSAYNQEIGDHSFFKELIYRAHEAKIIEPVFVPTVRKSMFEDRIVFAEYNFDYKSLDVRNWVKSKKWQLPFALSGCELPKDLNCNELGVDNEILLKSHYWVNLQRIVIEAINEYPAWEAKQNKVQKTILTEWLRTTKGITYREAEIIKTVLSDFFEKLK